MELLPQTEYKKNFNKIMSNAILYIKQVTLVKKES